MILSKYLIKYLKLYIYNICSIFYYNLANECSLNKIISPFSLMFQCCRLHAFFASLVFLFSQVTNGLNNFKVRVPDVDPTMAVIKDTVTSLSDNHGCKNKLVKKLKNIVLFIVDSIKLSENFFSFFFFHPCSFSFYLSNLKTMLR